MRFGRTKKVLVLSLGLLLIGVWLVQIQGYTFGIFDKFPDTPTIERVVLQLGLESLREHEGITPTDPMVSISRSTNDWRTAPADAPLYPSYFGRPETSRYYCYDSLGRITAVHRWFSRQCP